MRHFIGDRPVHLVSVVVFMALPSIAFSQMNFTLEMPDNYFVTGSPCGLALHVQNPGPACPDADLYVLLDVGTGGYWFYPGWGYYPPQVDWEDTSFAAQIDETRTIIPGFTWPQISGSFNGARFMAAAVVGTSLISNVSIFEFGWGSDIAVPDSVYIPPGDFMMGSYDEELCRFDGEDRHQVILSHGFWIAQTEVTQTQWISMFGSNPSYHSGGLLPVEQVTWYDCCIYCNRLSVIMDLTPCYYADASFTTVFDGTPPVGTGDVYWDQTADGWRLPTEAEWEYACRAVTETAYNSGSSNQACTGQDPALDPIAWYSFNAQGKTHKVAQKQPNAWQLFDMHGNVVEWCWDWWDFYPAGPVTDPAGPATGTTRILRGGYYSTEPEVCRSAFRGSQGPAWTFHWPGFRPVRSRL